MYIYIHSPPSLPPSLPLSTVYCVRGTRYLSIVPMYTVCKYCHARTEVYIIIERWRTRAIRTLSLALSRSLALSLSPLFRSSVMMDPAAFYHYLLHQSSVGPMLVSRTIRPVCQSASPHRSAQPHPTRPGVAATVVPVEILPVTAIKK